GPPESPGRRYSPGPCPYDLGGSLLGSESHLMTAPASINEQDRLEALRRYEILDTPPELDFDDLAALAALVCATPIALITLLDEGRQWFKARVGLEVAETPRDIAFCDKAIQQTDLFVVPDALADARLATTPLVTGAPRIRCYAGAPLVTPEGHALGTLCVLDRVPRQLPPEHGKALSALS